MKTFPCSSLRLILALSLPLISSVFGQTSPPPATAQEAPADPAAAWQALRSAKTIPDLPPAWAETPPTDESLTRQVLRGESDRLLALAEQGRAFARSFPDDEHRLQALLIGQQALISAVRLGSGAARAQLPVLDGQLLMEAQLPPQSRIDIRIRQVQTAAEEKMAVNSEEARKLYEAGTRTLIAEFPGKPEPWAMLLEIVDRGADPETRAKLTSIAEGPGPAAVKERAVGLLRRYNSLGKPVSMKFTALDGREIDLAALRGRVVVLDFWATWCPPCVEAIPKIKSVYDQLSDVGVEFIGINLDQNKEKVEAFLKAQDVKWPQYCDFKAWDNKYAKEFAIYSLPAMFLIDKNGILRDLDAMGDLGSKLKKLVEEPMREE